MSLKVKTLDHWIGFRVHKIVGPDEDTLIKFLHNYEKRFLVFEEEAERCHYQGVVNFQSKKETLRKSQLDDFKKKLKKVLCLNGNRDFATHIIYETPMKSIRYLCKGTKSTMPNIKLNNILLEDEVRPYHLKYWEENKNYQSTDAHRKYAKIMAIKLPLFYEHKSIKRQIAMKIIMYSDKKNLLIPDDYQLKKMVRTYQFKDLDEDRKWECAYNISKHLED